MGRSSRTSSRGRGSPVILVLGAVGDHRVWAQPARRPCRSIIVSIAYSFRYHHAECASRAAAAEYTVPTHAADLGELLRVSRPRPEHTWWGIPTAGAWPPWWLETIRSWFEAWCSSSRRCTRYYLSIPRLGRSSPSEAVAMAGVQDALDAGDTGRGHQAVPRLHPGAGRIWWPLSRGVQAVMLANAHVLPLLLRGAPAPFTCADAGRIKACRPSWSTGERTLRLFALTTDELEKCLPRTRAGHALGHDPRVAARKPRHVRRSGAASSSPDTVGELDRRGGRSLPWLRRLLGCRPHVVESQGKS